MIKIEIEKKTRKVKVDNILIGNDGENLQDTLQFCFKDEFVDGQARLELKFQNGETTFVALDKIEQTYTTLLSNVMTKRGKVFSQLVITENGINDKIPVFKSDMFYFICNQSINAEEETREPYVEWIDRANAKLNEVDNLDIDANKVNDTTIITITKKDKSTKILEVKNGEKGDTGPAGPSGQNGVDGQAATITIGTVTTGDAGTGASVINSGTETNAVFDFVIPKGDKGDAATGGGIVEEIDPVFSASASASITSQDITNWNNKSDFNGSYNNLTDKPFIPTKLSELTNDSGYLSSIPSEYVTETELNDAISSLGGGTGNVSSDTITSIMVVDELPETELEGVLYLVKEAAEPVVLNLYPSQVEHTETDGFTVTFKEQQVIADGSNNSSSVWGWTNHFNMNLEANKTYYLQFTNLSGSFDDSNRISQSDGIINAVMFTGYDSSGSSTNLINSVERSASGIYEKYTFTPTTTYAEYSLSMQVKRYNVFNNWTCSIVIAEEK